MGLWEFLRQWQPGRLVTGVVVSLLLHALLIGALVGLHPLSLKKFDAKRGEALMIDLPPADVKAAAGMPGAPVTPPPTPPAAKAVAAAPAPKPAPTVVAKAPPAPKAEAPRAARQAPPAPERVAAAAPAPRAAEPSAPPSPTGTVPAPSPASAPKVADSAPAPSSRAPETPQTATSTPREASDRQVASLPPQPQPSPGTGFVPDLRALRRGNGGAGGRGEDRAGIEGEPIPLDSTNPKYSDYLDQVRRRIKAKWIFPCVKDEATRQCEYKTTDLLVEFGIAKNGHVPFVTVLRSSGYPIYDDYAVNAIKLAMPFPPIPDTFSKTGVPIRATFSYMVESSLTNLLR